MFESILEQYQCCRKSGNLSNTSRVLHNFTRLTVRYRRLRQSPSEIRKHVRSTLSNASSRYQIPINKSTRQKSFGLQLKDQRLSARTRLPWSTIWRRIYVLLPITLTVAGFPSNGKMSYCSNVAMVASRS